MEADTSPTVRPNTDRRRYELLDGDRVIGKAHWIPFEHASVPERIFFHTTVDEEYRGQGLAARLARFALEDTIAAGVKVVTVCPYFKAYVRKHPEFQDSTVPVRPEHLAAVDQLSRRVPQGEGTQ
ncbi:MAG: GNAT family N-acetyltransferase [Arthrobacter sp.]